MASRKLSAKEKIDRYEHDETSGSDLDILTGAQRDARERSSKRLIQDLEHGDTVTEDDTELDDHDARLEWSGSENDGEAAYRAFKEKHSRKRKRPGATSASNRSKVPNSRNSTGVGRRNAHVANRQTKLPRPEPVFGEHSSDEEDDDAIERNQPLYLKQRKHEFEKDRLDQNRSDLDVAGLRLPPSYEDVDFSDDERLERLLEKPKFPGSKPPYPYKDINLNYSAGVIPASIAQWLKPFQVEGTSFLHELFVYQKGGILGDDMGLGKTIQVITALTAAFGKSGDERDMKRMRKKRRAIVTRWYPRVLVVCPGTLISNWKAEFDAWGWWHVYTYHGAEKENALMAAESGRLEVLITTYSTYKQNKSAINTVPWDCCVADECHIIKERKSEITQAMNEVNALCRIGLTGTAIQNKYDELWTLLNWTNPGRFGPLSTWKQSISDPLKMGQAHDATSAQLSKARRTAKKLVNNLLPEFFLRRMKTLIADQLPKKSDRVVFCPLTEEQSEAYENFIESDIVTYIRTATEPCDCGSGKKKGWCHQMYPPSTNEKWQNYVFPCMNILRNLASHIGLLIPSGDDPTKLSKELEYLKIAVPDRWRELYDQRESMVTLSNRAFCGKWKVLDKLLKFWHASGDKVLVFSHSVKLLRLLRFLFQRTSYNVSYLDGSMSYDDRARTVNDFNADPDQFVFLISTRAGGVGLNIASANKIVVVDPNWNPAYDLQAQDRAYRIGQVRDVEVFRLVSSGTIEEIVYARQIYKQQQANIGYTASLERRYFKGVQENKDKKGEIFGLQNLFSFQGDSLVLRDIVNKTNVAESRAGIHVVGLDMESQDHDGDADDDDIILPRSGSKEDDEDAVMSQVAALICAGGGDPDEAKSKKRQHKTDAIQGILARAGVEYTHENSEVVGTSKIEERLSKRAEEAGADLDEAVFESQSRFASDPVDLDDLDANFSGNDGFANPSDHEEAHRDARRQRRKDVAFKYHPAEEVRQRQFCTLARECGYEDVVEFAFVVEGWTPKARRTALERFYERLRRDEVEI